MKKDGEPNSMPMLHNDGVSYSCSGSINDIISWKSVNTGKMGAGCRSVLILSITLDRIANLECALAVTFPIRTFHNRGHPVANFSAPVTYLSAYVDSK